MKHRSHDSGYFHRDLNSSLTSSWRAWRTCLRTYCGEEKTDLRCTSSLSLTRQKQTRRGANAAHPNTISCHTRNPPLQRSRVREVGTNDASGPVKVGTFGRSVRLGCVERIFCAVSIRITVRVGCKMICENLWNPICVDFRRRATTECTKSPLCVENTTNQLDSDRNKTSQMR